MLSSTGPAQDAARLCGATPIAAVGKITPERARARAKVILGAVAHGHDPANQKAGERGTPTVAELADRFMADHVRAKRKAGTAEFYRDILDRIVKPALGTTKSDKLTRLQVGRLHSSLSETPFQANRVLAVVGSMYAFAGRAGIVPEVVNPARGIDKFKESCRERFLTGAELERLGGAIREAETTGVPWTVDESKPTAKHVPAAKRFTRIAPSAAAASALAILKGIPQRAKRDLVFGDGEGGFSGWSAAKRAFDTASGVSDWRLHDLRRTAGRSRRSPSHH